MKNLLTVLALVLAVAFTAPAFTSVAIADDTSAPAAGTTAVDKSLSSSDKSDAKPAKHKKAKKAAPAKKHKKAKKTDDAATSTDAAPASK
jgi:hypothetical protein